MLIRYYSSLSLTSYKCRSNMQMQSKITRRHFFNNSKMEAPKKLHIAMFPWLAFGHISPFLELTKQIARRGHKISFISTPKNIQRLPKIPPNLAPNINLVTLTLPQIQNLPQNAEATMDIPFNKIPYLKQAYDGLQDSLAQFLKTSSPDWIIYDFAPYWLPPIAADLGISCAFFSVLTAWKISFIGSSSLSMINGDDQRTKPEDFTVPPKWVKFPSKVAYRLHEVKQFFDHIEVNDLGVSDYFRVGSVIAGSDVIALRSCNELEADYIKLVGELHSKPAIPVGLLPPLNQVTNSDVDDATWITIKEWLDKQNKGSVVYVALGSEIQMNQAEVTELALGLELSGLPFFWAFRKHQGSLELPDGFEEGVKGRGVVWTSWAPQVKILSHESVGGFLTHVGFNSMVEGLQFGHALIMLPFFIDQGLNARVMEEKKVGIEVARDEKDGSFTRNSVAESVKLVMVEKEGKVYKDHAKEMRDNLFGDKEVHNRYIDGFVKFLITHRLSCRS